MKTKSSISNLVRLSYPHLSPTKLQGIAVVALGVLFLLPGLAAANVQSVLYIQGPEGSVFVNTSLTVPESCTVVDNVGASHDFSGHRAPCAIQAAKDTGLIADFVFKDFGDLGLFLESVNGIASGPAPDFPFWNLWLNGVFSEVGISQITLAEGDAFQLTYGPFKTAIIQAGSVTQSAGGPVVADVYPRKLDVESAVSFLVASQQQNGSFGNPLFTDWVAVALGAYEGKSTSAFYAIGALKEWLAKNPVPAGSVLTDFERRAMALMSLGISPYEGTSQNIIEAIVAGFDGQQFGNPDLVNDDIFAVLVLQKAGHEVNVTPLLEIFDFIFSWQRENSSFGSTDLTAAAVQALSLFPASEQRDEALLKARDYLAGQQESTGGFGNVYSTSWVLQAIAALNEDGDSWAMEFDRRTPEHFLALRQALDGGLLPAESKENRMWATSYAIPAALGKPWSSILSTFEKPSIVLSPRVSLEEEPIISQVVGENNELAASTVENIKQQIMALQKEVAVLRQLEQIQSELDRVALEVKAVSIRVIAFQVQQLAQNVEQPRTGALTEAPKLPAVSPVAKIQELETPSQDLSGITLVQEEDTASLAAEAKEAVGSQGLSPQLIILLVMVGAAVFVFSGGMNVVLPLLRKTFFRV